MNIFAKIKNKSISVMKKNAIIDIISGDIADIQLLISTFKDAERIPSAFVDALKTKYEGLGQEIALLDFWRDDYAQPAATQTVTKPEVVADN